MPRFTVSGSRLVRQARELLVALALCMPAAAPSAGFGQGVLAQFGPDLPEDLDGRLRGYEDQGAVLEDSSTALTYFLLAGLAILAVGVMFKSARRTHLD